MSVTYPLTWDEDGQKLYHTGVSQAVAYLKDEKDSSDRPYSGGENWDGFISAEESPDGADANDFYANNSKYLTLRGTENHKGNLKCYTYPAVVATANGERSLGGVHVHQQIRKVMGVTYREQVGNDTEFEDYSQVIHFVYGATISPATRTHETINDSPSPEEISFDYETVPVKITSTIDGEKLRNAAHVTIDLVELKEKLGEDYEAKMKALEEILYGKAASTSGGTATPARLPLPDEIFTILGLADAS